MSTPEEVLGLCLDNILIVDVCTLRRSGILCLRYIQEFFKNGTRYASDTTVAINDEDVHQVMVTTTVSSIGRSARSASNGGPLLVKVIFSGLILTRETINVNANTCVLFATESGRVKEVLVSSECSSTWVKNDHQFALNSSDDCFVASGAATNLLLDLVVDLEVVSGVIVVDADLQCASLSIVSKNVTSDISGVGVTSTRTSNKLATSSKVTFETRTCFKSQFDDIVIDGSAGVGCGNNNSLTSSELVLRTSRRRSHEQHLDRTSVSHYNSEAVTVSTRRASSPLPVVSGRLGNRFILIKVLDKRSGNTSSGGLVNGSLVSGYNLSSNVYTVSVSGSSSTQNSASNSQVVTSNSSNLKDLVVDSDITVYSGTERCCAGHWNSGCTISDSYTRVVDRR